MSTQTLGRGPRRPVLIGFTVGFAMAFVATVLALLLPFVEGLHPFLVPGAVLLAPLHDRMAEWNGLLNMALGGVVNGAVYAAVFLGVTLASGAVRGRATAG